MVWKVRNTFENARRLIRFLTLDGTTDRAEYFRFIFGDGGELPISIHYTEAGTYIKCTCKHCTFNEDKSEAGSPYLCAFKKALILKKAGVK